MQPVLFDYYCCAGGGAEGYAKAGFRIVGIDKNPQPNYLHEFIQGDALEIMDWLLRGGSVRGYRLADIAAFHASPPCQHWSKLSVCVPGTKDKYPDLITPTRPLLIASGLPWVIENVEGAPLIDPVILCGTSFGLRIRHHRLFESSFHIDQPKCVHTVPAMNPHNTKGRQRIFAEFGVGDPEKFWRREKGVEWMNRHEGREAVPPVFTHYIGTQLMQALDMPVAA